MAVDWSKYGVGTEEKQKDKNNSTRVDWSKYDPEVIKKQKAAEGTAIRASVPDLFNPIKQMEAVDKATKPMFGPIAPSGIELRSAVNKQLPGRDIPVVGTVLKGIDKLQEFTQPAAKVAEHLYTPGGGLTAATGFAQGTGSLISKLAPKLGMGAGLGATVGREAIKEGSTGAILGAGQSLASNPGGSAKELGESALIGGVLGGGLGAAAPVIGKGIGALINRFKKNNISDDVIQEVLALPAPRQRGNANTVSTPDVMPGFGGRLKELPAPSPLGLPDPSITGPTTGRITQQSNPYRTQFENLMKTAQKMQDEGLFTPGREDMELESLWSQMAGRDGVGLDELIQRAYPARKSRIAPDLVQRAKVTQASREVAGAPLPVKSLDNRLTQPQGTLGRVAPPVERVGRVGELPKPELIPTETQQLRPRTEVNAIENIGPRRVDPLQEADEIVAAVNQPRVRDRVYSYLDEAEKSARERISKRRNRLSANPLDEWTDHAIVMAAQMGKGSIKAADFTEALVREFGESIRPQSDRILRKTKEVLRTQERRASKEGAEAEAFNNSGTGNANSFDEKISRNASKKKVPFAERWEKIRTQFVDDLAPLEALEKRIRGFLASAEDSLYKTARLYKGTPEKAAQIVTTRLKPVVEMVEKAGYSADDIGRYALAKHAKDVNAAGYKSGFTNAEIDDILTKLGGSEMDAAQKELVKINRDMMKELVDSGVVSKQLAETLNERWQNYIPLFRAFDDAKVEFGGGLSSALANVASPIKALKGSERAVIDPLENMVKNILQSTNAAERNKVASQLAKLAEKDTNSTFIRKLNAEEQVGRKNVVNVKVDGESVKYEVEPEVYKALLNLDQESSSMLINILSKPASLLRAGATLTPEFSLRNPMRDVAQAFITSNSGFNPITDFGAGLIQSITKGKLYRDWIDNSGAYGNIISQDRDVHKKALEKVLKQPASKKIVNVVTGKGLINILRAITDTTESATKVGEYRAALRQGQTPAEAAYRSRDVMDFGRAGTSIRQANKVIAFLNANIQGKSKILRAIKANPVAVTARAFSAVTVPTLAIYALNNSDLANETQKQTIAESPDWQKDTFWLIAIPGTDQVARIPKPFDIAPIFANLPEKVMQYIQENDKEAFDGFVQRTAKSSSLPAQLSGLLPFIEGMANYSFFKEGSIIPQADQNKQYKDQYDPIRTTETAKLLAAGADKLTGGQGAFKNFSSPRIMDNTIKGLTAGLGTYATSAIDAILQGEIPLTGLKVGPSVVDKPVAPEKRAAQQPLAKAFLVDPLQGGKSMDQFYTEIDKLKKEKSSAEIDEKPFTKAGRLDMLTDIASDMSDINKYIRQIEKSDMTAKEKRDKIEPLTERRNKLAQNAVKAGVSK